MKRRGALPIGVIALGLTVTAAVEVALAASLLGGCGGSSEPGRGGGDAGRELRAGAEVFARAGCAECHTLRAAGAEGTVGPDLDDHAARHAHTFPDIVTIVRQGRGAIPPFERRLSEREIRDVARFRLDSTGVR